MTILVAGIGNIFLGDDAFGVEVIRRLADRPQPEGVRVADFGIRGFDLANALLDGGDSTALLVDATPRGGDPGTLYVIEASLDSDPPALEPHGMDPVSVLRLVRALGGTSPRVLVVGCEPATTDLRETGQIGLSPQVEAAVDEAITMIETLLAELVQVEGGPRQESLDVGRPREPKDRAPA
jgi:hydrogenase maturation protease